MTNYEMPVLSEQEPVARILKPGPKFKGICELTQARTYAEFPKSEVENSNGYWEEGDPLYTAAPAAVPEKVVKLPKLCVGVIQSGHAVMVPCKGGHWFNKTAIQEALDAAGIKYEISDK